jgi:hypothetical protein
MTRSVGLLVDPNTVRSDEERIRSDWLSQSRSRKDIREERIRNDWLSQSRSRKDILKLKNYLCANAR